MHALCNTLRNSDYVQTRNYNQYVLKRIYLIWGTLTFFFVQHEKNLPRRKYNMLDELASSRGVENVVSEIQGEESKQYRFEQFGTKKRDLITTNKYAFYSMQVTHFLCFRKGREVGVFRLFLEDFLVDPSEGFFVTLLSG